MSFFFYPKFSKQGTEATISWDVAGYYQYLPSIFIYQDLKTQNITDQLRKKYGYSPNSDQFYTASNGNKVLKYSIGMSILYLPAFTLAHVVTLISHYPSDGYSLPYQLFLTLQGLLIFFIGLYFLRKTLLTKFNDDVTTWVILIIGLATNLLEYGSITNAMSHVYLFTGYAYLMWKCHLISLNNRKVDYYASAVVIGLMALARPTEAIALLIPIIYLLLSSKKSISNFITHNFISLLGSAIIIAFIGSIQFIYWKYVSGNIVEYSYQDQGFSWLHPHIIDGLFSFRAGWLVYTPVMILSLIGYFHLKKISNTWFWTSIIFIALFIYIAFAWDIWWYGGSLGQRTMIQVYPILALPLAALLQSINKKYLKVLVFGFIAICGYLNVWLVYQAHDGGLIKVGEMTKPYFLAVAGKKSVSNEVNKLLDARYIHTKPLLNESEILNKEISFCLDKDNQGTPIQYFDLNEIMFFRTHVNYTITDIEHELWRWSQLIILFKDSKGEHIKTDMLRLQRMDNAIGDKTVYLDARVPGDAVKAEVSIWHAESTKILCIKSIVINSYE